MDIKEEMKRAEDDVINCQLSIHRTKDSEKRLSLIEDMKASIDKYSDILAVYIYETKQELEKIKEAKQNESRTD